MGSVPGRGTKIPNATKFMLHKRGPHAATGGSPQGKGQHSQKKKTNKNPLLFSQHHDPHPFLFKKSDLG